MAVCTIGISTYHIPPSLTILTVSRCTLAFHREAKIRDVLQGCPLLYLQRYGKRNERLRGTNARGVYERTLKDFIPPFLCDRRSRLSGRCIRSAPFVNSIRSKIMVLESNVLRKSSSPDQFSAMQHRLISISKLKLVFARLVVNFSGGSWFISPVKHLLCGQPPNLRPCKMEDSELLFSRHVINLQQVAGE
jgi:hypothetical protein